MAVDVITLSEFHTRLKSQGMAENTDLAFKCAVCGTIQSARTLICMGAGTTFDEVNRYIGFSCAGRWTNAGPHPRDGQPGRGCDWTLGGLLTLHTLAVDDGQGAPRPIFELASADEAAELAARGGQLLVAA